MTSLDPKLLFALCVTFCAAPLSDSRAGNFQKIYRFPLNASQGKQPEGALALGPDGNFYSNTASGGTAGRGTVFKVTPQGQHTTLYSFTGGPDGGNPLGSVVFDKAGNLYGATDLGGAANLGTVFKLAPDGTETVLHSFAGGPADGANPESSVIIDNAGNLYGVTVNGGADSFSGTMFEVTPAGVETVIHSFDETRGYQPQGRLFLDADGSLYGTTASGGKYLEGTVYRLSAGGVFQVLHSFGNNPFKDGTTPFSGLSLGRGGYFYGTTVSGGTGQQGTVYRIKRDGTESVVYSFSGAGGRQPLSEVVVDEKGDLYGTTDFNGNKALFGLVFRLTPGGREQVIHIFKGRDGSEPYSGLTFDASGQLYGVTSGIDPHEYISAGTIFRIAP